MPKSHQNTIEGPQIQQTKIKLFIIKVKINHFVINRIHFGFILFTFYFFLKLDFKLKCVGAIVGFF